MPWITRRLQPATGLSLEWAAAPLWLGVIAGAVVLAVGLGSSYHEVDGTIRNAGNATNGDANGLQPDADWRAYGRSQFGQRYSPLSQITPGNVRALKVAWTFRTGDMPGPNDPKETTFEVTPTKVRDTLYLCSQHQRLFALDAATGKLRRSYDSKVKDNPTFQHLTCRGVSYHETLPGATDADGAPAPTDCPHDLPAGQRRPDDRFERRDRCDYVIAYGLPD